MKRFVTVAGLAVMLILSSSTVIEAHPGRTDGNGCHTCRTNCEKWGLSYGEYHCHNGGSSNQASSSSGGTSNSQAVQQTQPKIPAKPKINYAQRGQIDGYQFKIKHPNKTLADADYTYKNASYKKAYKKAYKQAESELLIQTKQVAERKGKADAKASEAYQLSKYPANIIKAEYDEYYKQAYDKKEKAIIQSLGKAGKSNAYAFVYEGKKPSAPKDYGLTKFKHAYEDAYTKNVEKYQEEKETYLIQAKEDGIKDARATEAYQLNKAPVKAIKKEYENAYKEAYDVEEKEILTELQETGKKNAYTYVFDKKKPAAVNDYDLKKFKTVYEKAYTDNVKTYQKQKEAYLKKAKEQGEKDGKADEEENLAFLKSVKGTKFYTAAKEAYMKSYEENKPEGNLVVGFIAIGVILAGGYFVIRKIKRRKRA